MSRLTWSNCFNCKITFLISGRPIRSIRIGSLPATTVSPTTASSGPLPAAQPRPTVSLDDDAQNVEADRGIGPDLLEGKPPSLLRLYEGLHIDEEWFRSEAGKDAQAIAARALLLVNAEACRLTRRRLAPAFLHRRHSSSALPRSLEVAAEDYLLVLAGEGKGLAAPTPEMVTGRSRKR